MDIIERLRGLIGPDHVLTGADCAPWASDWTGTYKGQPLAVLRPGSTAEVAAIMTLAHDTGTAVVPEELLWKDTPKDRIGDIDWLMEVIDWELNVDPNFRQHHHMYPKPVRPVGEMAAAGYQENWICYRSEAYSAKELTVLPGRTVTIKDAAAYGMIMMQGHGKMGLWDIETPALIRYGQLTHDEFFISERAARDGVTITNPSHSDPIVMLKHFGPLNPDLTL